MAEKILLRDVFTPGGQPSVTYVSREHLGLEQRVADALARGFAINVVTGPTKSGKTVLCNHILGQGGPSVTVEGGQVRSEEDFWGQSFTLLTSATNEHARNQHRSMRVAAFPRLSESLKWHRLAVS